MKCIIIFALLFTVTCARPQQFPIQQFPGNPFFPGNGNGNNNNNGGVSSTTAAPTTAAPTTPVTTPSPQYLACLQSCPSTMEYNPICGTDNQNYHNNGRLTCAQRCGKNVASLRIGTCSAL